MAVAPWSRTPPPTSSSSAACSRPSRRVTSTRCSTLVAPEMEFCGPTASFAREGRGLRGPRGHAPLLRGRRAGVAQLEIVPHDFRDLGDRVLVFGRVYARGEGGYISDSPTPWLWRIDRRADHRGGGCSRTAPRRSRRRAWTSRQFECPQPEYDGRRALTSEIVLEAVPNVSEGRDTGIEAFGRALAAHGCSAARRPLRRRPQPQRLHAGGRAAGARRLARRRGADGDRAHRHARARGRASLHRRARRGPDRLPARGGPRARRTTRRWRSPTASPASWTCPCSCTGSSRRRDERRERAYFREGGVAALAERMRGGRAGARLRPAAPAPDRGRDARRAPGRRWSRSTSSSTPTDVERREGDRGASPRGRRRPAGRARDRRAARPRAASRRSPPTCRTRSRCRCARSWRRCAARPSRWARASRGAELVGLAPAAALDGFPGRRALRGFDERRHVLEQRMRRAGPSSDRR